MTFSLWTDHCTYYIPKYLFNYLGFTRQSVVVGEGYHVLLAGTTELTSPATAQAGAVLNSHQQGLRACCRTDSM